jgi:DNA-binding CsgD family transcriptional regulator
MTEPTSSDDILLDENDVRELVRLLGQVIAAKGDQTAKRNLVMEGLCRLLDADAWAWSLVHMELGSAPRQVVFLHDGIPDERLPHYLSAIEHEDLQWILNRLVVDAVTRRQPVTRRDRQLFSDWPEDSIAFRTWVDKANLRSLILMAWPIVTGGFSGIGIYRNADRPAFGARETRIAHIVLSEIPWLHEEGWGEERGDSLVNLSKRPREILSLLVQGRARNQIADDLGLSIHTVHGYVRDIYRHFGVNSHLELINRFTRGDGGDLLKESAPS